MVLGLVNGREAVQMSTVCTAIRACLPDCNGLVAHGTRTSYILVALPRTPGP